MDLYSLIDLANHQRIGRGQKGPREGQIAGKKRQSHSSGRYSFDKTRAKIEIAVSLAIVSVGLKSPRCLFFTPVTGSIFVR